MTASFPRRSNQDGSAVPLEALRRFARKPAPAPELVEHCEICATALTADHRHLLDTSSRTLVCACQACALLFSNPGAGSGKYRLIPRRFLALADFYLPDEQWDSLMIPVNMAFILRSTGPKPVLAFYPGPAGATESLLGLEGWEALVSSNPILNTLEPDVEALLINRVHHAREYNIVPIDTCYQLVGLIRVSWKGLSGGEAVWEAVAQFFKDLREKSQSARGEFDARPEL